MKTLAKLVPAVLAFSEEERAESWGRLLRLEATGGRLMTRARLERGDRMRLGFELGGEGFEMPAEVLRSGRDSDGYYVAELCFLDEVLKRRLGRALLRLLASE